MRWTGNGCGVNEVKDEVNIGEVVGNGLTP